jgi:hypothetical protein
MKDDMSSILVEPIQNKSAWRGEDIRDRDDWVFNLSPQALAVLEQGLEQLAAKGLAAPNFSREDIQIATPEVQAEFDRISDELENGYGFAVIRGLDPEKHSEADMANMYYMMGYFMGNPVTQNVKGDLLGYVQNVGDKNDKMTRVYETNEYLPYHGDLSDVVGLLCIRKAKEGGLSSVVSTTNVYNEILKNHREYLGYYYHPAWFDHMGEPEPSLSPIFSYHEGKLASRYLRAYIELGHERRNVPLSQVQIEALDIFDAITHDPAMRLDMMLEPGDIQFCNNYTILHSRTSFIDFDEIEKRRKLLRLWLKMPNARSLARDFPGRNGIAKREE